MLFSFRISSLLLSHHCWTILHFEVIVGEFSVASPVKLGATFSIASSAPLYTLASLSTPVELFFSSIGFPRISQ
jgi:hypothetical protein